MWAVARLALSFLALAAMSNAQDSCTIHGLTEPHIADGIRIARGSVTYGSLASDALLFQPTSTAVSTPPILFSHSDIAIADAGTDLRPMAARLAKHGASVLVLERTVLWEPRDDVANREPGLVDCASKWLVAQANMDVAHAVYVGPRLNDNDGGHRRRPVAMSNLRQSARGLWVPLAEAEDGEDTADFTKPESQDRLLSAIEAHWLVDVTEK